MSRKPPSKKTQIKMIRGALKSPKTPKVFLSSLKKRLANLLGAVAILAALAMPARAQYIGNVGIQTVQQTLATALPCTGAAQTFNVANLGQTQHLASTAAVNATSFQVVINGIDRAGNIFLISDVGGINSNISASNYFPIIQVSVTCLPITTATFTLSYSGSSVAPGPNAGSFLSSQVDKFLFRGVAANVNQNISFQSPFGSSSGTLVFQYVTAAVAGSSVTVSCLGSTTIGSFKNYVFSPANDTNPQEFNVPASTCPQIQMTYTSGGAASTLNLEYIFDPPGQLQGANQINPCMTGQTGLSTTVAISVGANTTQRVVAPFNDHKISVCGIMLSVGVAGTVQITSGTGATCGTGTTNLSGAMSLAVGTPLNMAGSPSLFVSLVTADGMCITTAGGATAAGLLSFNYIP